jgi:prevent-host-death family protein
LRRARLLVYFDQMRKQATVSLYEAKTRLSHLVDRAARGEEVVITRHGRPAARLVAARAERTRRKLGALRGKIRVASDFDAPLSDEMLALFEGRGA